MKSKYLLIGNERICKQIAFVMQYEPYVMVTNRNDIDQYPEHEIIVCGFKKQLRLKNTIRHVLYLDDICRQLDQEYPLEIAITPRDSWWRKLKIKMRGWLTFRNLRIINKIPVEKLKASELLLKVIYGKPTNVVCDRLEKVCHVYYDGKIRGCSPKWVIPYGDIISHDPHELYNNTLARIIKLSSLNRSYCLCNFRYCQDATYNDYVDTSFKELKVKDYPDLITIAIDKSCNLKCPSCRQCYYTASPIEQERIAAIIEKLLQAGWLEKTQILILSGEGEVFYSKNYRQLLKADLKRQQISIISNGILFNKENWNLIKDKYQEIFVAISIDAATKETYQKLRGGNFEVLVKNLKMLGELRQAKKITHLQFNFVVQKDNYLEMTDFVAFAKKFHVDQVFFMHMNSWGTFSKKEFVAKSLIIKDKYLVPELYQYLKNPVFKDPIVNLWSLNYFIVNSDRYYQKRLKREQQHE